MEINRIRIQHVIDTLKEFQEFDTRFPGAFDAMEGPLDEDTVDEFVDWYDSCGFYVMDDRLWSEGYMMEPVVWNEQSRDWHEEEID